jgi:hypothetical protein
MDSQLRNLLQRATQDARRLLETEFQQQLEGTFDIHLDGNVAAQPGAHLDAQQRLVRGKIIATIEHLKANSGDTAAAVEAYLREAAFTSLNRFVALKMLEARKLVLESVSKGDQSSGFKEFCGLAPGLVALPDHGYRLYLECLFDEIGTEVKVLFDRRDPASLLWPRRQALQDLLDILNRSELAGVWGEDETIGWAYQYFNSQEERRAMRDASAAPRNSHELAVRNQFFTPRYVVAFLTDNTLGRIWYEMTQGQTGLKEQCKYLVRRPTEIFLKAGEQAPAAKRGEQAAKLSQAELLKQPVFIPHRPLKDPRTILMLDPACGSMHFGLYSFDLFEVIYDEAWELEQKLGAEAFARPPELKSLNGTYPTKQDFLKDVPRLIIEHNLHGIDIDPRCAQIAVFSLWLRAQKSWQRQGLKPAERPVVRRSNIVCAEPMPGEKELLREFVEREFEAAERPVFAHLLGEIFTKMQLAGEAGSLLKIEEDIRSAISGAKGQWTAGPQLEQTNLFADLEPAKQKELKIDLSGITDETFWEQAEERIYAALRDYAEQAENGGGFQRSLFAEDAARGVAFIDVCRKRYDVVEMNPPFGEAAKVSKPYIEDEYEHSSSDILHAFVERGLVWLDLNGREGVISARTGFFLGDSKNWRRNVVFQNRLACFADLGLGVLDDALVEVAAYAIERGSPLGGLVFTNRQLDTREKETGLLRAIQSTAVGEGGVECFFDQSLLNIIPDYTFAYWAPATLVRRYADEGRFKDIVASVRQGVATADDFRFARLGWEVSSNNIGRGQQWQRFSKGGEYSPPYDDIHLLVNWGRDAAELWSNLNEKGGVRSNIWMLRETIGRFFFQPGVTYTVRTASAFAPKVLPSDCIFSHNAQSWFPKSTEATLLSIGYMSCRVPQTFLELAVGSGDIATAGSAARRYTTAVVESVPAGLLPSLHTPANLEAVRSLYRFRLADLISDESSCHFSKFHIPLRGSSVRVAAEASGRDFVSAATQALGQSARLDQNVTNAFALSADETAFVDQEVGLHPASYTGSAPAVEVARLFHLTEEELMAEAVQHRGSKRWFTKKSYFVDRRLEIICHLVGISPSTLESLLSEQPITVRLDEFVKSIVSEALGSVFGRWDARYATSEKAAPELPDPFAPLPICPPGQLQNSEGLPAEPKDVASDYPLRVSWEGILVDDEGHKEDIVGRVREMLQVVWKEKFEAIEQEACEILSVKTLRDWFRQEFFSEHIKRYSKSRRKAPIYWQLGTSSGSYSVWLYYHRFTT